MISVTERGIISSTYKEFIYIEKKLAKENGQMTQGDYAYCLKRNILRFCL